MYFNFRLFFKALSLAFSRRPFRFRRWAYVIFFTGLFGLMWLLVALGRALDWIFFPAFRKQQVREPVFIVAPPRSGTTLTQKLLSLDQERFVHVKLYQTIFPSVFYQCVFDAFIGLDRLLGHPLAKLIGWAEKRWFGGWDDMHKMRFNQPEEDDAFFLYCFVSEAIFLLFPYVDELWEAGFPDALRPAERGQVMAFYKSCLQRHLYANGPGKTLLSKATQSSGSVESLREAFPGAKFITILRHPYKSVASHVSVFYPIWQAHSPEITKDSPTSKAYARLAVEWFKHLFRFRTQVEPSRYHCIDYRDLVKNPREAIEKLYEHFGWTMDSAFRERLAAATQKQREFKSAHQYTLEEFGLSKEWIQHELGELLDFYKLER
jgi:omega-hydroxy-beta-dihydromenaquinone-9 sulfotransferase